MHTAADFDLEVVDTILSASDIAALLDVQLNYVLVNDAACRQLQMQKHDLIGKCILDVFPHIIASENHRNLLLASEGTIINNFILHGLHGDMFRTNYQPIFSEGMVQGIMVSARKITPGEKQFSSF